ncbi:MAG: NADH-quinone oxidoreductase subunit M [Bacteroidota bacterium]
MQCLLLLIIPLIFIVVSNLLKVKHAGMAALMSSILTLVVSLVMAFHFSNNDFVVEDFNHSWISSFGINFHLGVDGISFILVLLTTILTPFIIAASLSRQKEYSNTFYSLILLMQIGMLGAFMAKDAFLFYVSYEVALIPIYFICGLWGGENRIAVTLKFFIYTLAGSLFMLVAIIYLYLQTPGNHTFEIAEFYKLSLTSSQQTFIFWGFFLAFAVKIPIFPFHSWQPSTYTTAPTAGTMLLAGIMLKMGLYGLIRFVLPIAPEAVAQWNTLAIVLCVCGIIYGSVIAIRQNDLKTLIAFSSLAHVGLIAAGIFSMNTQGIQGAMIQMFNHGVNAVALFFLIDLLERRSGTRLMDMFGGIASVNKKIAIVFAIVMLGSVGLPLTNGFVGEFLLLMGVYQWNIWAALFAGLTIILGAVYMLRLYRNVFFGEISEAGKTISPMTMMETIISYKLVALIILLGIFPNLLLNISAPAVDKLLNLIAHHSNLIGSL